MNEREFQSREHKSSESCHLQVVIKGTFCNCSIVLFNKFGSAWNVDRPTVELADGLQLLAEDVGAARGWVESGGCLVPNYCDLVSRFMCLTTADIVTSSHEV